MPSLDLHPVPPDLPFCRLDESGCGGDGGARFPTLVGLGAAVAAGQ
jgi:hypothetical protein